MAKKVKFRKIPLKFLIDTLLMVYETGAEYIDIQGVQDIEQDTVKIIVQDEYMINNENPPDDIDLIDDKLDDDSLNDLII
jgi:hypothetical protein